MKSNLTKMFIFAAGAAIGSAVAWYVTKCKYEEIIKAEFDYREQYGSIDAAVETDGTQIDIPTDAPDEYYEIASEYQNDYMKEEKYLKVRPYVISSDEFGQADEYDVMELTYFADGVVADDWGEMIENVDEVVGLASLLTFGDNNDDPDTVYVRNDERKCDYEICADTRNYYDVYDVEKPEE